MDKDDSLEKLTSHEEFQERVVVVSYKNWIAAAVVGLVLFSTLIWSIFGRIAVYVEGEAVFWTHHSIYGVVPFAGGALIRPNMPVQLGVSSADSKKYGYMKGTVKTIYPYLQPIPPELHDIPLGELQNSLASKQPYIIIAIEPIPDPSTITGYQWTTKKGAPLLIEVGTLAHLGVIVEQRRPISYLIPGIQ